MIKKKSAVGTFVCCEVCSWISSEQLGEVHMLRTQDPSAGWEEGPALWVHTYEWGSP